MTALVAYKWAADPQDASVGADGVVDWSRAKAAISEYDPVAAQIGREIADASGTELVGISVGTSATASSMATKAAMSRGMDRGLVVADDAVAGWNLTKVASALAALVRRIDGADIVLTGDASVDENAKMTSALLAGYLEWPCFQDVKAISRHGSGWSITQYVSGGLRTIEVAGPVVVAMASDAVLPKIPGMKDILAAGKKTVERVEVADLALPEDSLTVTARTKPARKARKRQIFTGPDAVSQLVSALKAEGLA